MGGMRQKRIWWLGAVALVGAWGGGAGWYQHRLAARAAVPAVQPAMPAEVAARVDGLIGRIWAGGADGAAAVGELALVYDANGYAAEAEQVYRWLAEQRPTEVRWAYLLSDLLGAAGRLSEAEPWLRQVVEREPANGLARRKLGDMALKLGRPAEAQAAYAAVLAAEPNNPYATLGLARVAVEDGRWLEARRLLEGLAGSQPSFGGGLSVLATVEDVLGETGRAAEMRRRAEAAGRFREERDPRAEAVLDYCLTAYGLRVAAAATDDANWGRQLLERATRLAPTEVANWQQLGRLLQDNGDAAGAEAARTRALALEPANAQVWLDRIGAVRARRDLVELRRVVEQGVAACPEDAGVNFELGRTLVQVGALREAVDPLVKAVALDPYNQTAAVELVALWFRLDEPAKAEAEMQAALGRDGDFAPMLEFLVRFHVRAGRRAEAEAALARLARAPHGEEALASARAEFAQRFLK